MPYIYCHGCKKFILCNNCTIPLAWHKKKNIYSCHRCGKGQRPYKKCPYCHTLGLSFYGAGTERIVELLEGYFPGARVLKMDRDTVESPSYMKKTLREIYDGVYNIIVGTQIITKGHHFPKLILAAVIAGDQGVSLPDFRAQERSFQLLTQVLGRAGRELPGRVFIQTANPGSLSIRHAITGSMKGFFDEEISSRKAAFFPPFCKLLLIRVSAPGQKSALETTTALYNAAKQRERSAGLIVIGPLEAPVFREKGLFRYQIYIKAEKSRPLIELIRNMKKGFSFPEKTRVLYDMDPYNLL